MLVSCPDPTPHAEEKGSGLASYPGHVGGGKARVWLQYRVGGASPVAQAMAGPMYETFQDLIGHMLVQAGNVRACRLQAKCMPAMPD